MTTIVEEIIKSYKGVHSITMLSILEGNDSSEEETMAIKIILKKRGVALDD